MTEVCKTTIATPLTPDRAIHIWANRGSDFISNRYANNLNFTRYENPDGIWSDVRRFLMLDKEDTDCYLRTAQIILSNYTGLASKILDNKFTQKVENLPHTGQPVIDNGSLVNNGNRYSFFKKYKGKFPIPRNYTITWSSKNAVKVDSGSGNIEDVPVKLIQTFGDPPQALGYTNIIGEWGDVLPFDGVLRYIGLWDLGSIMSIDYIPQEIDYSVWIASIESNLHFSRFLENLNLHQHYTLAKEPAEKLAVLYLSLILHYDANSYA